MEAVSFAILTGLIVVAMVRMLVLLTACGQDRVHELHDDGRHVGSPR
ncbi:MAG TPA: hypothetical protein VJZ71_17870 [Phycisphaerae bacterium]|nr:hypothetical protein [Phycisphaerae bacterium]